MDDPISRGAALDAIDNERKLLIELNMLGAEHVIVHHARRLIEDLPAVGVVEVVHGRWQGVSPFVDSVECSACRYCIPSEEFKTPYCPWCGAKMDWGCS